MGLDTDTILVGAPLPRIAAVRHIRDYGNDVIWADGLRKDLMDEVDLFPVVVRYPVFAPLRDDIDLFASVRIIDNGNVLAWDGGCIDMAALYVERLYLTQERDAKLRALKTMLDTSIADGGMVTEDQLDAALAQRGAELAREG